MSESNRPSNPKLSVTSAGTPIAPSNHELRAEIERLTAELAGRVSFVTVEQFNDMRDECLRLTKELCTANELIAHSIGGNPQFEKLQAERDRLRARLDRIDAYIRAHVDEPRMKYNYVAANVLDICAEGATDETTGEQK